MTTASGAVMGRAGARDPPPPARAARFRTRDARRRLGRARPLPQDEGPRDQIAEALAVTREEDGQHRGGATRDEDLVALDEAMHALAQIDPRKAQVVELRFFGGLSVEESAEVLKVSQITVMRDWSTARAWLYREINGGARNES